MKYQLKIDTQDFTVEVGELNAGSVQVAVNGTMYDVIIADGAAQTQAAVPTEAAGLSAPAPKTPASPAAPTPAAPAKGAPEGGGDVVAPIPGLILSINVKVGDAVQAGQAVVIMEAMKMENELTSHVSGVVKEILVHHGAEVSTGDVIMRIG